MVTQKDVMQATKRVIEAYYDKDSDQDFYEDVLQELMGELSSIVEQFENER